MVSLSASQPSVSGSSTIAAKLHVVHRKNPLGIWNTFIPDHLIEHDSICQLGILSCCVAQRIQQSVGLRPRGAKVDNSPVSVIVQSNIHIVYPQSIQGPDPTKNLAQVLLADARVRGSNILDDCSRPTSSGRLALVG